MNAADGILLGVGAVDAVELALGHEDGLALELEGAQSGRGESVLKYGLPVPAAQMTTRPFSRCRMARRRM